MNWGQVGVGFCAGINAAMLLVNVIRDSLGGVVLNLIGIACMALWLALESKERGSVKA